jgi:hypothetical protein
LSRFQVKSYSREEKRERGGEEGERRKKELEN